MGYTCGFKWEKKDTDFLRSNYLSLTNKELADYFNVSDSSIEHKLKRLGLKRPKSIIGSHISRVQKKDLDLIKRRKILGKKLGSLLKGDSKYKEKWKENQSNNPIIQEHRINFGDRMHKDKFMKEKMLKGIRESQKHKESNRAKAKMILENNELNEKRLFFMKKAKSSEKHRIKISREGNPMWKGGLSFEPYTPEFNSLLKSKIRKRDNYICQNCGIAEEKFKLNIHHINYDKQDNNQFNLISLCRVCHSKTNTKRKY